MGKYCRDKKYNFNSADMRFKFDESYACDGFYLGDGYSELTICTKKFLEDEHFYTHEFSEMSLFSAIRKCTHSWSKYVKFKYFESTRVAHLIAPYAEPNKLCLFPDVNCRKAYKVVLHKLTVKELEIRRLMGENW
jgi:hypothetical protein